MRKDLVLKIAMGISMIAMIPLLSGCSLAAYKPSVSKVEKVAQECINPNIKSNSNKIEKGKGNAGVFFVYSMIDDRGIEFEVKLYDNYVVVVEPIPPFLSDYRVFYNDYCDKVILYYEDEVAKLLQRDSVAEYDFVMGVNITFLPGTSNEEIADIVMQIDELINIDYNCGGINQTRPQSDSKTFWDGFRTASIRTMIKEEVNGMKKTTGYGLFTLSGQNGSKLTYDQVLDDLNAYEAK